MTPTSPNPPSGGLVLSGAVWSVGAGTMLAVNALESQLGPPAALNILLSSAWGALACMGLWRLGARWTLGGRASGALGFSAAVALALGIHLIVDLGLTPLLQAPADHAVVGSNRWYMVFVMRLAVETRIFVYLLLYGAFGASALTVLVVDRAAPAGAPADRGPHGSGPGPALGLALPDQSALSVQYAERDQ